MSVSGCNLVRSALLLLSVGIAWQTGAAETPEHQKNIDIGVNKVMPEVLAWRRDIHAHPELGNRETRTAALVAEHLRSLGFDEVRTRIAHTGVVGVLRGGLPGKVVALRADMDALPVTERTELPFSSKVRATFNGQDVGVMHACGHDVHTSVLMGTASVLAGMRDQIPGTVVFIFQPAEEGPPAGETGGAALMIKEGVLDNPKADVIFGLHTWPIEHGYIGYRSGGTMAGADGLNITITGRQTHGAVPWGGVDPIVVASQVIMGLQTIISRQVNSTAGASIVTIGSIHGGVRGNIIPDSVEMEGTIRVLDPSQRDDLLEKIEKTVTLIAESGGASADVRITPYAPVTYNDPALTRKMAPTLARIAPKGAIEIPAMTPSEDFSFYQEKIPGVYFFLGVASEDDKNPASNHSPYFFADEAALPVGVRVMSSMTMDYLTSD